MRKFHILLLYPDSPSLTLFLVLFAIWLDIGMFVKLDVWFIASPLCWPIKVLTQWVLWLFLMAIATLVLSSIMAIITWVLMVKTNELPFVFMIHAFLDMEIPKPSTNPLLDLFSILICFHDELTFSFCGG